MATSARDNFFKECPAVMEYSAMTDYRTSQRRDQYIKRLNSIQNDYAYKDFLHIQIETQENSLLPDLTIDHKSKQPLAKLDNFIKDNKKLAKYQTSITRITWN
jgi:hypothetical protein